jgi:predicted acetyltransferase
MEISVAAPRQLCRLTRENSAGLEELAREFEVAGEVGFELALADPEAFFEEITRFELGRDLPSERVRQSEFWLLRAGRILGSSRLRNRLIPVLELDGGNIGYEIRPSERRQGLGTALLRLTLVEARAVGLPRVFLTADSTNRPSIRVIENNGGVFTDTSRSPHSGRTMNRYWIELSESLHPRP